jgi:D-alanine-D-alanine ligase
MKVALVYNLSYGFHEYEAEFDSQFTINFLDQALSLYYDVTLVESTQNFEIFLHNLLAAKPDIIFNVAEGFIGPAREAFYPALYDQLHLRFCGPDATNLIICHNKVLTKNLLNLTDLPVPRGVALTRDLVDDKQIAEFNFPLIVKLNSEGSGMGLSEHSIVEDPISLREQVKTIWKAYQRRILIEEYIEGKDISMAYVEGIGALGPCEVICTDHHRIYDYEYKTVKDELVVIKAAEELSKETKKELKIIVEEIAKTLDIRGYAKVDFRVKLNGEAYILEVNGQISFHPQGEFMVSVDSEGYTMSDMVHHIVEYANQKEYPKVR